MTSLPPTCEKCFFSVDGIVLLVHRDSGVVVQPLRCQHLRQLPLLPTALLQLGPLVLEPDLDLVLVQPERLGQVSPPLLRQVPVLLELALEPGQLLRGEGGSRPLLPVGAGAAASATAAATVAAVAAAGAAAAALGLFRRLLDLSRSWT